MDKASEEPARRLTVGAVIAMEQRVRQLSRAVVLRNGMLYGPDTWYAPQLLGVVVAGTIPAC